MGGSEQGGQVAPRVISLVQLLASPSRGRTIKIQLLHKIKLKMSSVSSLPFSQVEGSVMPTNK